MALGSILPTIPAHAERAPQITLPGPSENIALSVETVASFAPGTFLEGIAFTPAGDMIVSIANEGRIARVDLEGGVETIVTLPIELGRTALSEASGPLVVDAEGTIYVSVGSPSGKGPNVGIWRVSSDGSAERFARFPDGTFPNGIAMDKNGHLYVADSFGGRVWRVDPRSGDANVWISDSALAPRSGGPGIPGANGIAYHEGALILSVSDSGRILRIPVLQDGTAGTIAVVADGAPGDGIAVDKDGVVYVTTHLFDTVMRVDANGVRETVADRNDGARGAADAAFGVADGERAHLYVVTDGGLFGSFVDPSKTPAEALVLRVRTQREGAPSGWRILKQGD